MLSHYFKIEVPLPLTVTYRKPAGSDNWIAHCKELDLTTADPSFEKVQEDIVNVCAGQVQYAHRHGLMNSLMRDKPEPQTEWHIVPNQSNPPPQAG